jgi:hypothetical protein
MPSGTVPLRAGLQTRHDRLCAGMTVVIDESYAYQPPCYCNAQLRWSKLRCRSSVLSVGCLPESDRCRVRVTSSVSRLRQQEIAKRNHTHQSVCVDHRNMAAADGEHL